MGSNSPTVDVAGESFGLRRMRESDRNAVFASWMRSAREELKETKYVSLEVFQRSYQPFVETLLDTERTIVLYRPASPGVVHAWACAGGPDILHWAYVPWLIRGHGFGRAVMTAALAGYPKKIWTTTPVGRVDQGRFSFNPFMIVSSRERSI